MTRLTRRSLLGAALAAPLPAWSQTTGWPDRPIRLIVPYPSGGAADKVARALEPGLQTALGQPVVFDYKPGGSGAVGVQFAAQSAPDGYSILLVDNGPITILPAGKKVGYDPESSLTPIGVVGEGGYAFAAHSSFAAKTLADLVKISKARPNTVLYGTPAVGGPGHLSVELFQTMSGADLTHVPFKGGSQVITDLLGGHIPLAMISPGTAVPFVQSGRIHLLAVTTPKRSPLFPDVPTVMEQGYPEFDASVWIGLFGPARLSAELTERHRRALAGALANAETQRALREFGFEPGAASTESFPPRVRTEFRKWGTLMKSRGIVLE